MGQAEKNLEGYTKAYKEFCEIVKQMTDDEIENISHDSWQKMNFVKREDCVEYLMKLKSE